MSIYPPFMSTCDECIRTLQNHGISASITPQRGSHGAEVHIYEKDLEKFKTKILGKKLEGKYHNFFFSAGIRPGGFDSSIYGFYYVSFQKKK